MSQLHDFMKIFLYSPRTVDTKDKQNKYSYSMPLSLIRPICRRQQYSNYLREFIKMRMEMDYGLGLC